MARKANAKISEPKDERRKPAPKKSILRPPADLGSSLVGKKSSKPKPKSRSKPKPKPSQPWLAPSEEAKLLWGFLVVVVALILIAILTGELTWGPDGIQASLRWRGAHGH